MFNIELSDSDFEKISRFVYDYCGIYLHEGKRELIKTRLGKRLRAGNFKSFAEYYRYVTSPQGADELIAMIDAISTNLTYFFREERHFQKLMTIVTSLYLNGGRSWGIKIWSAGCSTGEEAYTIAICLKECLGLKPVSIKILATDISTQALKTAVTGIYPMEKVQKVPHEILRRYFQYGQGSFEGYVRVKDEIKNLVEFRRFNLIDEPPSDFRFDIIFCRNVMIYFDRETQATLVSRLHRCLNKGGFLFVGHSESLSGLKHPFRYVEPGVYKKDR
ncbi:MAG: protein-glutamate O-methyltransferase CheR [Syntrophales bacterium]|nr:protein-glutamate O-methyltransferase CheR [Syntrophales bacterium]